MANKNIPNSIQTTIKYTSKRQNIQRIKSTTCSHQRRDQQGSAYASRPMEPDATQLTTPSLSDYQTPSTGASVSTLAPIPTTEQAEKSQQTPELPKKGRRASSSPGSPPKERHRSQTRRETAHDDDGYGKETNAP